MNRPSVFVALVLVIPALSLRGALQSAAKDIPTSALSPHPGQRGVPVDTQLKIHFPNPITLGSGNIQIRDAAGAVVDSIEVSANPAVKAIGGFPNFKYFPLLVLGSEVIIMPARPLEYNKAYSINIDAGAFKDAGGSYNALGESTWSFKTKAAPPAKGAAKLTVAADGPGDFATVQGAIDFVPEGNTTSTTIFIKAGTYNELVCFTNKHALTFLGEDRKKTVIQYANNDRFNSNAGGNPFAPGANPSTMPVRGGAVYRRGLFLAHRVSDLVIANLTLHNTTPVGGSQAEAIILNGTPNAHAIVTNCDLYSFQDTVQINGQAYINDCYIEGDVDFMWGTGPCFFENVHAKSLRSNAYYTQIRNPPTNHGYVYKHCLLDGGPNISGDFLSRIDPGRFPASEVVLLDCTMTSAVGPVAWRLDVSNQANNVHFWECNSHDPNGKPIDTSKRAPFSKQLVSPADKETIVNYSDPKFVLGGWEPKLGPLIARQPAPALVTRGEQLSLSVTAVGVPEPTYQWKENGVDIPGATSANYEVEKFYRLPGSYGISVIVSNNSGKLESAPAEVKVESK